MSQIAPNQISLLSVAFAALGSALLLWGTGWLGFIATAACVQLRLVCNLLDGMVAIEGGKSTPTGALFNESPTALLIRCSWCRSAMLQGIRGWAGSRRFLPSLPPTSASWVAR
jgi:phosphatidylglycerophosphate synthase